MIAYVERHAHTSHPPPGPFANLKDFPFAARFTMLTASNGLLMKFSNQSFQER